MKESGILFKTRAKIFWCLKATQHLNKIKCPSECGRTPISLQGQPLVKLIALILSGDNEDKDDCCQSFVLQKYITAGLGKGIQVYIFIYRSKYNHELKRDTIVVALGLSNYDCWTVTLL